MAAYQTQIIMYVMHSENVRESRIVFMAVLMADYFKYMVPRKRNWSR